MNIQKIISVIIGVIVIVAGAWYFTFSSGIPADNSSVTPIDNEFTGTGDVVAVVNGEKISRDDFEASKSQALVAQDNNIATNVEAQNQFDLQVVDGLIAQALLRQAIRDAGVVVPQEDIDAYIDATIMRLGGNEAFEQALAAEGLSEEAFRVQAGTELTAQAYLEQELNLSSVTATNEEVEAVYAQATAQDDSIPLLEEVRDQVEQSIIQQKQQTLFVQFIDKLRAEADVEVLL